MHTCRALPFLATLLVAGCTGDTIAARSGFAEVNGTRLYYEIAGRGEPLVLLHGWSFDTRSWDDQMEAFTDHFAVLRYDLRGFGRSALPKLDEPYSHTEDLVALLAHLDLGRIHLLGHSFGGRIAIDFAFKYPERLISLILPDGAVDLNDLPFTQEISNWIGGTWQAGREQGVEAAREIWLAGSPLLPAMENARSSEKVRRMVEAYSGWHWENPDPSVGIEPYGREKLAEIEVPTLIVLGALNPAHYHEVATIQREHIPNSQFVSMAGVGHALNIEDPDEFNRIVLDFLNALDGRQ